MMYGNGYGYASDMTWWMGIYSAAWFVLLAVAITAMIVWIRRSVDAPRAADTPRQALEYRLARGEIGEAEFQRLLVILQ